MGWFFRAIQADDGTWRCRRGLTELDQHPTLDDSLHHLRELAQSHRPASLFVHWHDGRLEQVGELPLEMP